MRSQSRVVRAIAVLAFVVGLAGYTVFGWRFGGGTDSPVALVLALLAVAVAAGTTLRNRS
jgi:hypothetical protein